MAKSSQMVDDYIAQFPDNVSRKLTEMRALISSLLPDAEEKISYKIPSYYQDGYIVYFAGYEKFVSVYPVHNVTDATTTELQPYLSGKATARFDLDKPLPVDLIKTIVTDLLSFNRARLAAKKVTKK